jgi:hypothetical protein
MGPSAAVLVCALELLGRSRATAPVVLIESPPPHASSNVEAFVTRDPDTIYLITTTAAFRDAMADPWGTRRRESCRKVASIIVHEEWHLRFGADERGAYLAQLTALQVLGAESQTIGGVRRAMAAVLNRAPAAPPVAATRARGAPLPAADRRQLAERHGQAHVVRVADVDLVPSRAIPVWPISR